MVASRLLDVAAVDATVLAAEVARSPLLGNELRCVASLGPFPTHPIVARAFLSPEVKSVLAGALAIMHGTTSGLDVLRRDRIVRFVAI